jgi:hypothetical protein
MTQIVSDSFKDTSLCRLGLPLMIHIPIVEGVLRAPITNINLGEAALPIDIHQHIQFNLTLFCRMTIRLIGSKTEVQLMGSNGNCMDKGSGEYITLQTTNIFHSGDVVLVDAVSQDVNGYWNIEII